MNIDGLQIHLVRCHGKLHIVKIHRYFPSDQRSICRNIYLLEPELSEPSVPSLNNPELFSSLDMLYND